MHQPLKNKTIVVTRSENQAEEFILQLKNLGGKTIALPLISTSPINQSELLRNLSDHHFDWVIFTSPNAVKFFFESIAPDKFNSKIAVVGSKTQEVIKDLGLIIDFIPTKFIAKQLAEELPLEGQEHIFIPRSTLAKNDAVEILEHRACTVTTLAIYENCSVNHTKDHLKAIFDQKIDFITFTSGSTIDSFIALGIELNKEQVICIGPETAKVASQHNISVTAIASPHNIIGMIEAIKKASTN